MTKLSITPKDVCWFYDTDKEYVFEESQAIAYLLISETLISNSTWWDKTLTKKQQQLTTLAVNCNDVFAWGCADAEELPYNEIEDLWNHYVKDPSYGPTVWCITKRKQLPQKPVYDEIQSKGIWNLDKMKGLQPNPYDTWCKEQAEIRKLKKDIGI